MNLIHLLAHSAVAVSSHDQKAVPTHNNRRQETSQFSDVPKGHWAYDAVLELKRVGILNGYPDDKFRID